MELPYRVSAIDFRKNDQKTPEFLSISPNGKIPAIVDGDISLMESGAILLYLAQKTGKLAPEYGSADYWSMLEWLMWQMGGFGPMLGQAHYFIKYNPGKSEYAEERYFKEAQRLYSVLDGRLSAHEYIVDDLSIADIAIWPWASRFEYHRSDLHDYPNVCRWYENLAARPAFQRGYSVPNAVAPVPLP
jgi:GST-like protein